MTLSRYVGYVPKGSPGKPVAAKPNPPQAPQAQGTEGNNAAQPPNGT